MSRDFAGDDPALRPLLDRYLSPAHRATVEPHLAELGALAATEIDELAATADANPPALRQYSPAGDRIDEIDHHPAYHRLAELAFSRFGLAAMSHRPGVLGFETRAPHVAKYALSYLFVQSEFGLACPLSMTDSAARVLRLFDPDRYADRIAALASTDMAELATGAMFMTEVQGGTDVGLTATEATDRGDHWTLRGRKWFASNAGGDVILTLGRVPGQGEGTRGLGMFLVPRLRPDGSRNSYTIDRLKEKLGARSMASAEVTLEDAYATPVGELTSGFRQMAEMVNVSRLSNAMRAAALMRRSVRESVEHTRQREVFGRLLFDQPLMRGTILPLLLDAEAALGLVLECADRLTAADSGDAEATALIRVLTPLAKHLLCKQARRVTGEAMEIRGGNGYIEDWVNPRLLRDAHLGSIWEGSSNVIALDVLRCLRRQGSHRVLADTFSARLAEIRHPGAEAAAAVLRKRWDALRAVGDALLEEPADEQEFRIPAYADSLTRALLGTLLLEQAGYEAERGGGFRKLLVAHAYLNPGSRAARAHLGALADGGPVPATTAQEALHD
jgi:alkylation response protein AidB-like acyl-CoA dehydrogenase